MKWEEFLSFAVGGGDGHICLCLADLVRKAASAAWAGTWATSAVACVAANAEGLLLPGR